MISIPVVCSVSALFQCPVYRLGLQCLYQVEGKSLIISSNSAPSQVLSLITAFIKTVLVSKLRTYSMLPVLYHIGCMTSYRSLTHIQHFVVNKYILHHPHSTLLTQLEATLLMIPSNYKPTLLQMSLKV